MIEKREVILQKVATKTQLTFALETGKGILSDYHMHVFGKVKAYTFMTESNKKVKYLTIAKPVHGRARIFISDSVDLLLDSARDIEEFYNYTFSSPKKQFRPNDFINAVCHHNHKGFLAFLYERRIKSFPEDLSGLCRVLGDREFIREKL